MKIASMRSRIHHDERRMMIARSCNLHNHARMPFTLSSADIRLSNYNTDDRRGASA